jgi:AcrR family transcriptional regulator
MTVVPPPGRRVLGRPGPAEHGRRAILEAAGSVFASHGYLATTIDAIADELGATKGRVYHYYRGKAEIFLDVVVTGIHDLIEEVEPLAGGAAPADDLYSMAHRHAEVMMSRHSPQRVSVQAVEMRTVAEFAAHGDVLAEVFELRRRYEKLFIEIVEAGKKSGEFETDDVGLVVKAALGSLNWIPIWYSPDHSDTDDIAHIADIFARFILRSIRKN